jgi:hypothetical protein
MPISPFFVLNICGQNVSDVLTTAWNFSGEENNFAPEVCQVSVGQWWRPFLQA